MMVKLRVGHTYGYQPYREVEPVPPYPRINPQQPRDDTTERQSSRKDGAENHVERRFTAMRSLIDKLKAGSRIVRVDYMTAEQEMVNSGSAFLGGHLTALLTELQLAPDSVEECLRQVQQKLVQPEFQIGSRLLVEDFLPLAASGVREYRLSFSALELRLGPACGEIIDAIRGDGRFIRNSGRIALDMRIAPVFPEPYSASLDLSVLTAVCEVDEAGRKALLYPRTGDTFVLYADKQINLSI